MKTLHEELQDEKDLLSDPARWTKGYFARDSNGYRTAASSKDTICWCQAGASYKFGTQRHARLIKDHVAIIRGFINSIYFNDHEDTTHEMLMEFYDDCIKEAKTRL